MCSNCLTICSNWSATFFWERGWTSVWPAPMPDNLSCSADSFRFEIAISEKQIALFSVHGWQCFVFTVHSVWCSRDFYVATFLSGLANQKPCNVSHRIAPAGLRRTCRRRTNVSHHPIARDGTPSPVSRRSHISHRKTGALSPRIVPEHKRNLVFTGPFARLQNLQDLVQLVVL